MKQLTINPNNKRFYSDDFIKGFECGTQRQFEADKADRPQGEWIHDYHFGVALPEHKCSVCGEWEYSDTESNYCPNCGARMVSK